METRQPKDFADQVAANGAAVLRALVTPMGMAAAARTAGVSRTTLSSWCHPGLAGFRPGYPPPLPLLDRICRHAVGHPWIELVGEVPVGARIALPPGDWRDAMASAKIPETTRRRLSRGVPYPDSLLALDRIACARGHAGFWAAVRQVDVAEMTRTAPVQAMRCLFVHLRS